MRLLFPIFILIIFALPAISQNSNAALTSSTTTSTSTSGDDVARPKNGGKTPVPPDKARPIDIPKTTSAITIDGRPDEEAWKTAAVFKDFYQTSPGYNTEPSKPTEVRMMYDEHDLYIAFKCWDDKDKIRATVAQYLTPDHMITVITNPAGGAK